MFFCLQSRVCPVYLTFLSVCHRAPVTILWNKVPEKREKTASDLSVWGVTSSECFSHYQKLAVKGQGIKRSRNAVFSCSVYSEVEAHGDKEGVHTPESGRILWVPSVITKPTVLVLLSRPEFLLWSGGWDSFVHGLIPVMKFLIHCARFLDVTRTGY